MSIATIGSAPVRRCLPVLTALSASLLLGACASGGPSPLASNQPLQHEVKTAAAPQTELQKATAYWGKQAAANPQDPRAAVNYARNLKAMGAKRDAMSALQQAHGANPDDRELNSEYGRLALEHDQITLAQKLLERADDANNPDWRVLSALGTAHAKQGKHAEAIALFERAKVLAPDQPSVLNNLAMAHAMAGQANKAEGLLRQAAAKPDADHRVQQNLALVLGLNGKHDEARTAGADNLPADASAHNANVVRQMVEPEAAPTEPALATVAPNTASRKAETKSAAKLSTASVTPAKGSKGKSAKNAEPEVDANELVRRLADSAGSKQP